MIIAKDFIWRERILATLVVINFLITIPFLYAAGFVQDYLALILQALVPSIAAFVEYVTLWHSEEKKALDSKYTYIALFMLLVYQPVFFDYGLFSVVLNPIRLFTIEFWVLNWSFIISWLTGRAIVRLVYIQTRSKSIIDSSN